MAAPKLYYFNGRGLGEIVRLTLAAAEIEFTEEFMSTREQYERLLSEGKLAFSQLPLLEIDGLQLVQSRAIVRYVANKGGILGKSPQETARIDMLFEGSRDFLMPFLRVAHREDADISESLNEATSKYLPTYEKVLKGSTSGFLVGDGLSLADLALLELLLLVQENLGEGAMKKYPGVQDFYKKISSIDAIAKFLSGPQRKKPNNHAYWVTVREVLRMYY